LSSQPWLVDHPVLVALRVRQARGDSGPNRTDNATRSSGYQGSSLHSAIWFSTGDQDNGYFQTGSRG
jgi:hypothetical protein